MAGKDKAEKKLEDYNDVFADILNVLLFKKNLIKEDHLKDGPTESIYKAVGGELHGQFLADETINKFQSTFKHVAHFFKYRDRPSEYQPLDEEIKHLGAFLDLLEVFTGDSRYVEIKAELLDRQKEGKELTMCSVVEKFTNDGIKQGIGQGIEQGIKQGQKQVILNMYKKGCDTKTISDLSGISLYTVEEVLKKFI